MKTSFATIALALVGAAMAAPTAETDANNTRHPYSVDRISLRHLTKDNSYVFISTVGWRKQSGEVKESTTCTTHW